MYDVLYQGSDTLFLLDMLLSCHNHRSEIYHLLSGKMTENTYHLFSFSLVSNFNLTYSYSYSVDKELHKNLVRS